VSDPPRALIDGRPAAGGGLDPADRGLAYGDGVFRTVAIADGAPELWDRHMAALGADCARLAIPAPDPAVLAREASGLIAAMASGVLKIIVTRGAGGRGYRPPAAPVPTRILALHPAPDHPLEWASRGVAVRLCETRLSHQPALAGVKHLNRLDQVLARAEWSDPDIAEGLMRARDGAVVCGTMTNLFLVRGARLLAPEIAGEGVAGVARGLVLDHARDSGIVVETGRFTVEDLRAADGAFLTNAVIGLWPVGSVDGHVLGRPWLTARIDQAIHRARRRSRAAWKKTAEESPSRA